MLRRAAAAAPVAALLFVVAAADPTPAAAEKSDACKSDCQKDAQPELAKCAEKMDQCQVKCPPCKTVKCEESCIPKCGKLFNECAAATMKKRKSCVEKCQER